MSYNVQVGSGGYIGWKTLERTLSRQRDAFSQNISIKSAHKYFSEKARLIKTADDVVSDYRLLTISLRAFGLDADISNKFFIKKVLEADPDDSSSIVNRLSDKRYLQLNQAMRLGVSGIPARIEFNDIISKYEIRSFEKNVGERHPEIELALNARRELPEIAATESSNNAKWYQILGSRSLRRIFEVAYGLGNSFSALPIDRQLSDIKSKTQSLTGSDSMSQFKSTDSLDALLRRYLLRNQIRAVSTRTPYSNALTLLKA